MDTTTPIASETPQRRTRLLPWILFFAILGLAGGLLYRGYGFYSLPLDQRVESSDFRTLGPGGLLGHGYGIIGTALILTNLLYLVRRRMARTAGLGSIKAWLDMHVFTGLAGGMLILFHSAFQSRTPVALVSAIALGMVILTGLVGRFLHFLAPAPDPMVIATHIHALDATLEGAGARARAAIDAIRPTEPDAQAGFLRTLLRLPTWMREARAARASVNAALDDGTVIEDHAMEVTFRKTRKKLAQLAGREVRTVAINALLRSWRTVHRLLAILMLLTVPAHIVVAWLYGYRWIWSQTP